MYLNLAKGLFLGIVFLSSSLAVAQGSFEKGYFISSDQRIECWIKNEDWRLNPTTLYYKMSEEGDSRKHSIDQVSEFGVDGVSKYVRATVTMDVSPTEVSNLTETADPILETRTVFLRTIIQGSLTLYEYNGGDVYRLFLQKGVGEIEELPYKQYRATATKVREVDTYRLSLRYATGCEGLDPEQTTVLPYGGRPIAKYLRKYFKCKGENYVEFGLIEFKSLIHLRPRIGMQQAHFSIDNPTYDHKDHTFAAQTHLRPSLELEVQLPIGRRNLSVTLEPNFQYFNDSLPEVDRTAGYVTFDYSSIELPISLRYSISPLRYFKAYAQAGVVIDFAFKSSALRYERLFDFEQLNGGPGARLGVGFEFFNRVSVEANYATPRTLMQNFISIDSYYHNVYATVGYKIF